MVIVQLTLQGTKMQGEYVACKGQSEQSSDGYDYIHACDLLGDAIDFIQFAFDAVSVVFI